MKMHYVLPLFVSLFFCCASNTSVTATGNNNKAAAPVKVVASKQQLQHINENNAVQPDFEWFETAFAATETYAQTAALFETYQSALQKNPPKNDGQQKAAEKLDATFSAYFANIAVQKTTAPPEIVKNDTVRAPFSVTITAKDTQKPLEGVPLTVTYPAAAKNGVYEFGQTIVETNNSGRAEFIPPSSAFSCRSEITFSLALPYSGTTKNILHVSLPYRVYTDLRARGTSIALVDLDKNGKPFVSTQTSSLVLTALIRQCGFSNIGNSDFKAAVISGNPQTVQREAVSLFGNSVTSLIYGTTSYETLTEDSKTEVVMTADIYARNIPKNESFFFTQVTVRASEPRESTAITAARQKLAAEIAERVKYGL